ncbi:MAG: BON domain-containing protein [Steroidobacteraceae bacterium]
MTISLHQSPFRLSLLSASLALTLGVAAPGVVFADEPVPEAHSKSVGAAIDDTVITAKVKTKLMNAQALGHSDIDVTTTNGVVTLEGSATSDKAKSLAESTALSVEGVKSVDNNLKTPSSSKTVDHTKRAVSDSWITTKVKSEILADSLSKGFDVNVETVHGVVVLKGSLASQGAINHVKNIAEKVEGVKSVDASGLSVSSK